MFSRSLLLVLLVLTCLQSFTLANYGNDPVQCCFKYQTHKMPVKVITEYKITARQCAQPGVIFTLKDGRDVCVAPEVNWVKSLMNKIDQRLFSTPTQNQDTS